MQTNFTPEQLLDPATALSERILRNCVHCGFCLATCPTYQLSGNELDSPRGRIYLIKDKLENDRAADIDTVTHIDRCLSCLSCMTTCPSGVDYQHLVDHARIRIEDTYQRPVAQRFMRGLLAKILPYPNRLRLALRFAGLGRSVAPLLRRSKRLKPLAIMAELAPKAVNNSANAESLTSVVPDKTRGRVALLQGCVQSVTDPAINMSAQRLCRRLGFEVIKPAGEACCGSLLHHMGREQTSLDQARHMVDVWMKEVEGRGLDAIIITASGCGSTVKDYAHMLRDDPEYAEKSRIISALACDVSEFLGENASSDLWQKRDAMQDIVVAYHAPCSLQHGQKIVSQPADLLKSAGFVVRLPVDAHLCCGSAGTYNILQSEIADQLQDKKVRSLVATGASVVASGNIGCITQIAAGGNLPVVHHVELLDWASGGPKPVALNQ